MSDVGSEHWELPVQAHDILAKLRQRLIEEPTRFNMSFFGMRFNPKDPELKGDLSHHLPNHVVKEILGLGVPACGTVACNAGNILIVTGKVEAVPTEGGLVYDFDSLINEGDDVEELATQALFGDDPTVEQRRACSRLFYFSSMLPEAPLDRVWPLDLEKRYKEAETAAGRVQVNLERLDLWETTGR